MRLSILILSLLFPFLSVAAQPKHEVRAAWLTALHGLDWPCTRAVSPQSIRKQKEELAVSYTHLDVYKRQGQDTPY